MVLDILSRRLYRVIRFSQIVDFNGFAPKNLYTFKPYLRELLDGKAIRSVPPLVSDIFVIGDKNGLSVAQRLSKTCGSIFRTVKVALVRVNVFDAECFCERFRKQRLPASIGGDDNTCFKSAMQTGGGFGATLPACNSELLSEHYQFLLQESE